jgi:hypothetical protein
MRMLEGEAAKPVIEFDTELIVRESSAPPKAGDLSNAAKS